jgi:hypothetical protein
MALVWVALGRSVRGGKWCSMAALSLGGFVACEPPRGLVTATRGSGGADMGSFLEDTAPPGVTGWTGADSRLVTQDEGVVCDLVWATSGAVAFPSDERPCPDCDWVFTVDASFQAEVGTGADAVPDSGCETDDYAVIYAWRPTSNVPGALTGLLRWDRAVWVQAGQGTVTGDLLHAEQVVETGGGAQATLSVLAVLD